MPVRALQSQNNEWKDKSILCNIMFSLEEALVSDALILNRVLLGSRNLL